MFCSPARKRLENWTFDDPRTCEFGYTKLMAKIYTEYRRACALRFNIVNSPFETIEQKLAERDRFAYT